MRKFLLAVCLLLGLAPLGLAQGSYYNTVTDTSGHPISNAIVRVYVGGSCITSCSYVNIYSDFAETHLIDQVNSPVVSDSGGNYGFFLTASPVDIQITARGGITTWSYVTPNTGTYALVSTNSLVANFINITGVGAPALGTGQFFKTDATQNGGTGLINTLMATLTASPSGSTQSWAKNAIQGYCINNDTTSSGTFQDCIGVLGFGQLSSPGTVGRVIGLNGVAIINSGADGTGIGMETDVTNNGTSPATIAGPNPKIGTVNVCAGPNPCTAGESISGNPGGGGTWKQGVHVEAITAGGIPFNYGQAGNTTCSVTGAGTGATCAVQTGSTDLWGLIKIVAGTTPSSSGTWTVTFSQALGIHAPTCVSQVVASTWNARASFIFQPLPSTTALVANWDNNSTNLTAASSYYAMYMCQAD